MHSFAQLCNLKIFQNFAEFAKSGKIRFLKNFAIFDNILAIFQKKCDFRAVQRSALCRSRQELSNEYLLDEISVDTAENEPLEVWGRNSIQYSIVSLGIIILTTTQRSRPLELRLPRSVQSTRGGVRTAVRNAPRTTLARLTSA